ncbi:hypothetical protein [Pseudomonas sichuanensis]|uniref:hypothetical protein n=1 Tax=Pseudomonas sichuanensis TaxID=2213015 RepID=UPI000DA6A6C7|nr:hypothetical protein [Pseudomonas sichuanensis]
MKTAIGIFLVAIGSMIFGHMVATHQTRSLKCAAIQVGNERQLSPHEQQNGPTPAGAPAPWSEERYSL